MTNSMSILCSTPYLYNAHLQTKAGASLQMFPPLVRPVFPCPVPAVLSIPQTPAALPHS